MKIEHTLLHKRLFIPMPVKHTIPYHNCIYNYLPEDEPCGFETCGRHQKNKNILSHLLCWNVMTHGEALLGKWRGKLTNAVVSQYSSHYLGTWCIQHYYRWCAHLGCQQSTELTRPTDLNGLFRFAERRNLVSARVPSHVNWPLHCMVHVMLFPM